MSNSAASLPFLSGLDMSNSAAEPQVVSCGPEVGASGHSRHSK